MSEWVVILLILGLYCRGKGQVLRMAIPIESMFNTITAHSNMEDDENKKVDEDIMQVVQLLVDEACKSTEQVFICLYILQYLQFAATLQCLNKYFQLKKRGWSLFYKGDIL